MKNPLQIKISSLDFLVTPIHISFKSPETHSYILQFDKGAQILKKFQEEIIISPKHSTHRFKGGQTGKFKLLTERGCNCQWGLYRIDSNEMNQFIDSLPINLLEFYNSYVNSLRLVQAEYLKVVAERNQGKEVSRIWRNIKDGVSYDFPSVVVTNKNGSIQLCFRLEIRCQIDNWCDLQKPKSTKSIKQIPQEKQVVSLQQVAHEEGDLLPKGSFVIEQCQSIPMLSSSSAETPPPPNDFKITHPPPKIKEEPIFKKGSVLSDIIQCSNQSSNLNYGEKKESLKEIFGIPEEESQLYSPIPSMANAKHQSFQNGDNQAERYKRRSNTFDSNHNELPLYNPLRHSDGKRTSMPEKRINEDYELEKEEERHVMETAPQSTVTNHIQEIAKPEVKKSKTKWFILAIIIILLCGASATYLNLTKTPSKEPNKTQAKKQQVPKSKRPQPAQKPKSKKSKIS